MSGAAPTRGPHFFCSPGDVGPSDVALRGGDARHLARVLRAAPGDPVSVADGAGAVYQARVAQIGHEEVRCLLEERHVVDPPRPVIVVVQALPKGRKLDGVVQALSEVGVDRLVPVHSARSEPRPSADKTSKVHARWEAVAHAAGKQARRARLLDIAPVGPWAAAFDGYASGAVLWEEACTGLSTVLGDLTAVDDLLLGVGPEGGLTADEVTATGLPAARLGPTVLRTEHAALVAASITMAAVGRLG